MRAAVCRASRLARVSAPTASPARSAAAAAPAAVVLWERAGAGESRSRQQRWFAAGESDRAERAARRGAHGVADALSRRARAGDAADEGGLASSLTHALTHSFIRSVPSCITFIRPLVFLGCSVVYDQRNFDIGIELLVARGGRGRAGGKVSDSAVSSGWRVPWCVSSVIQSRREDKRAREREREAARSPLRPPPPCATRRGAVAPCARQGAPAPAKKKSSTGR